MASSSNAAASSSSSSSSKKSSSSSKNIIGPTSDIYNIGNELFSKISTIEKDISKFGRIDSDDEDKDYDEEVIDPEKRELLAKIDKLEETQQKMLARFQAMKKYLDEVSQQASKLRGLLRKKGLDLPSNVIELQKLVAALEDENERLRAGEGVSGGGNKRGGGAGGATGGDGKEFGNDNLQLTGKTIMAGTVDQLLEALGAKSNPDAKFANMFLITYHHYTKAEKVIEALEKAFTAAGNDKAQQLKTLTNTKYWIEHNNTIFLNDTKVRSLLNGLIDTMANSTLGAKPASTLTRSLETRMAKRVTELKFQGKGTEISFLKAKAEDIAKQLTLLQSNQFRMIQPDQILNYKTEVKLMKRTSLLNVWIKNEINKSKKKTNSVIKKFIQVADICRHYNNFNGAFGLYEACTQASEDKKKVDAAVKKYDELKDLLDPAKDYANYKALLKRQKRPGIPYFKYWGNKITACSKMAAEKTNDNDVTLINFARYRQLAEIIQQLQVFQDRAYPFPPDGEMLAYITAFGKTQSK